MWVGALRGLRKRRRLVFRKLGPDALLEDGWLFATESVAAEWLLFAFLGGEHVGENRGRLHRTASPTFPSFALRASEPVEDSTSTEVVVGWPMAGTAIPAEWPPSP